MIKGNDPAFIQPKVVQSLYFCSNKKQFTQIQVMHGPLKTHPLSTLRLDAGNWSWMTPTFFISSLLQLNKISIFFTQFFSGNFKVDIFSVLKNFANPCENFNKKKNYIESFPGYFKKKCFVSP